jgi:hypothetical protein
LRLPAKVSPDGGPYKDGLVPPDSVGKVRNPDPQVEPFAKLGEHWDYVSVSQFSAVAPPAIAAVGPHLIEEMRKLEPSQEKCRGWKAQTI